MVMVFAAAYLHVAAARHARFRSLLEQCMAAATPQSCRLILYADEARPGNVLRPDKGRMYLAVYYTFSELPQHVRRRAPGWMPGCFLRSSEVAKLAGGPAAIIHGFLRMNFGDGARHNLETSGVRLPGSTLPPFRAHFQALLGDEKLLKDSYGVKGARRG